MEPMNASSAKMAAFDGKRQNFSYWEAQVNTILASKRLETFLLHEIDEGDVSDDGKLSNSPHHKSHLPTGKKPLEEVVDTLKQHEQTAKSIILQHLSPNVFLDMVGAGAGDTPKKMWSYLTRMYGSQQRIKAKQVTAETAELEMLSLLASCSLNLDRGLNTFISSDLPNIEAKLTAILSARDQQYHGVYQSLLVAKLCMVLEQPVLKAVHLKDVLQSHSKKVHDLSANLTKLVDDITKAHSDYERKRRILQEQSHVASAEQARSARRDTGSAAASGRTSQTQAAKPQCDKCGRSNHTTAEHKSTEEMRAYYDAQRASGHGKRPAGGKKSGGALMSSLDPSVCDESSTVNDSDCVKVSVSQEQVLKVSSHAFAAVDKAYRHKSPGAYAEDGSISLVVDSGADHHLVKSKQILINYKTCKHTVKVANGTTLEVKGVGDLSLHVTPTGGQDQIPLLLRQVYYVPHLYVNLLSVFLRRDRSSFSYPHRIYIRKMAWRSACGVPLRRCHRQCSRDLHSTISTGLWLWSTQHMYEIDAPPLLLTTSLLLRCSRVNSRISPIFASLVVMHTSMFPSSYGRIHLLTRL